MAWNWRRIGMGHIAWIGLWPGRGPFSHLPPWQRPGWLSSGFGRRLLRLGHSYTPNQGICARFPWLPRWWWTNPIYPPAPYVWFPSW